MVVDIAALGIAAVACATDLRRARIPNWLTLGEGLTPKSIDTDSSGTGRASLFRDLSSLPAGAAFDIQFRVIDNSSNAVLQSDCYRFVVRD